MEKKYQIFISSTYEDLKTARKKVQDAILSMYHFPVGMELFGAADEDQWEIINPKGASHSKMLMQDLWH